MKAARLVEVGAPIRIEEVPVPEPGPGEVLVRVETCGVCASDLNVLAGKLPTRGTPPITLGHEPAGVVAAAGAGVVGWKQGDRVAIIFNARGCGQCASCDAGRPPDECDLPLLMGVDFDGAWAEYVCVPSATLVRLPDSVSLEEAALLTDAVATPYNALIDVGEMRPGDRIAVIGVGGLGTHAVQLARLSGASVIIAVDPDPASRSRALEMGADFAVEPAEDGGSEAIRTLTQGTGVDIALDFVGSGATSAGAVLSLAAEGRCVVAGVGLEPLAVAPSALLSGLRLSVRGVLTYKPRHFQALLRLVAAGRLDLSRSISARLPLANANEALETLRDRSGNPVRIILVPQEA